MARLALLDEFQSHTEQSIAAIETPFGPVAWRQETVAHGEVITIHAAPDANLPSPIYTSPAIAYAAKALGAERVIAVVRDAQVDRPVTPADFIEFTSGRFTTFFAKIGAGYVQQDPPFCPELREALLKSGVVEAGVLLVVDDLPPWPARQWWAARDVTLISTKSQPEGTLCRELELCFAVLAVPAEMALERLGAEIVDNLPVERSCGCSQTMVRARQSGKLPADWREWIKVEA